MQFDIATSLVDIQSQRLLHHKQIQAKLDVLRTQQPHSCVRKQALDFLQANRGKIVDDECTRILSEIELLQSLICNGFSSTEYLPLTFDQERLVGGNDFVHIFALAKMMHEQFCGLAAALGDYGVDLYLEALESHLESFSVLLETYSVPQQKPVFDADSTTLPKMHKTLQYKTESDIPARPSRCISGYLLAQLNQRRAKSQACGGFLEARSPFSSPRRPFLRSYAAVALHSEYSECEESTRCFRRSVLRYHYGAGQRYARSAFIKQNQHYELENCTAKAQPPTAYPSADQRFKNYPQPPADAEPPGHACERMAELYRACGVDFDQQYARCFQQYENALAKLSQPPNLDALAEQSVLLTQSRWVAQQNEAREMKFLAAAMYQHGAEQRDAEHADEEFYRVFEAWSQQVIAQAARAPIPDDYVAIYSIQQRRTSYTNVVSGKSHSVRPEVAAVRKWIDSQWDSHVNARRSRADAEILAALAILSRTVYHTTHKGIGTVLLDQLGLEAAAQAAEHVQKMLATRTP